MKSEGLHRGCLVYKGQTHIRKKSCPTGKYRCFQNIFASEKFDFSKKRSCPKNCSVGVVVVGILSGVGIGGAVGLVWGGDVLGWWWCGHRFSISDFWS